MVSLRSRISNYLKEKITYWEDEDSYIQMEIYILMTHQIHYASKNRYLNAQIDDQTALAKKYSVKNERAIIWKGFC